MWAVTARQAGATLDVRQMVNQAYAVGHGEGLLSNVRQQMEALRGGTEVPTAIRYDSGPANVLLTQIAQMIDRTARDAELIIQPDLRVVAVTAQTGLALDIDATRIAMHQRALNGDPQPVVLVVRETPPSVTEVEQARRLAEALLDQSLTITFAALDCTIEWVLSPQELAAMSDGGRRNRAGRRGPRENCF